MLAENFSRSKGIWIRFLKKASDVSSINTSDAGCGVVLRVDHRPSEAIRRKVMAGQIRASETKEHLVKDQHQTR